MGPSYQAEEGMTWGEWVDSGYNTGNYICHDVLISVLICPADNTGSHVAGVVAENTIIAGNTYTMMNPGD